MNKVMEWLPKNVPPQVKNSVVHGDFRVDNLIYDPENPTSVLAVLDWELSTIGDPMADAVYACMAHHIPNDVKMLAGLQGLDLKSMGIPSDLEYMTKYCENSKIPIEKMNFNFYASFAFFRMAAILQGVYKRSLHGQARLVIVHISFYFLFTYFFINFLKHTFQWAKCSRGGKISQTFC